MKSLIRFVIGTDFNLLSMLIILNKSRSIVDECALNIATRLLPWLFFVVELESHDKHDQLVDVQSNKTWLCRSLQVVRTAGCLHLQDHFPNTKPKTILSRNIYIVWRTDDQGRGIGETQPGRSPSQIKQSAFARSEIIFNGVLLVQDHGLTLASCTFQGQVFNIQLAMTVGRWTIVDGCFELVNHVQVKIVGYSIIIGSTMFDLNSSALIRRSAENIQVSVQQFKKRKNADIN